MRQTDRTPGRPKKRAQTIIEYTILMAIVSAAFIMMVVYVRRAVQGQIYLIEDKTVARR